MDIGKNKILAGFLIILMFLAIYSLTEFALTFSEDFIYSYGLAGVFAISFIGASSIIFYIPVDATIFFLSKIYPAELLSLIAGIGSGLGEMSSYFLGYLGHEIIDKQGFKITKKNLNKYGFSFVFIASLTPIPYDIVGVVGGYMKLPFFSFLGATMAGKVLRYYIISKSGYLIFNNH